MALIEPDEPVLLAVDARAEQPRARAAGRGVAEHQRPHVVDADRRAVLVAERVGEAAGDWAETGRQ
jgi:hypothetical protein